MAQDVDRVRRWDGVDPILWAGDGSALFALEWRKANPPAGPVETFPEFWACLDAVAAYKRSVSIWLEDEAGDLVENRDDARLFRLAHPGCSFGDVVAHVALLNLAQGDG